MFSSRVLLQVNKTITELSTFATKLVTSIKAMESTLKPPAEVRHMKILDKSTFLKTIEVPVILIESFNVSKVIQPMKKYLLKLECFRPVVEDATLENTSVMHLNPCKIKSFDDFDSQDKDNFKTQGITEANYSQRELELNFKNYSVEDIFRAILPTDKEGMASFTKIGHVVHVNLRDHLLPYKQVIGEVLLEKVAGCRTVVNKIDSIDNTYRNFKMEVLAGEEDFMVTVKENRCTFDFDFSTVYWNSRLCTEHERIVNFITKDEVLFDVFAGVGPFSIPVAKRGSLVWANDLNPASFKWMQHNAKKNKIGYNLKMFNKDGKNFILEDIKIELIKQLKDGRIVHIAMNLPALASEFLKYFNGLYNTDDLKDIKDFKAPIIYLYCFAKGEETEEITMKLVNDCMNMDMTKYVKELFKEDTFLLMKIQPILMIRNDDALLIDKMKNLLHKNLKNFAMGKKGKKNNVFKVAGAKSLKLKQKAKMVKTNLRDLNVKIKEQVAQIDKDLVNVQHTVRQKPSAEKKQASDAQNKKKVVPSLEEQCKNYEKMETESKEVLNNLDKFNLST